MVHPLTPSTALAKQNIERQEGRESGSLSYFGCCWSYVTVPLLVYQQSLFLAITVH